jgi:hypothetical protein
METANTPQSSGLKRNTIDKYYTKPAIAELCLTLVRTNLEIAEDDVVIEPSAGNGRSYGVKSLTNNFRFYDLSQSTEK